jgi:hypothetical protein
MCITLFKKMRFVALVPLSPTLVMKMKCLVEVSEMQGLEVGFLCF